MKIIVKVGTSTLAYGTGSLNLRRVSALVRVLADLKNSGHDVVLVTSGAVGVGASVLGIPGKPKEMSLRQAAAAVGQCELMGWYGREFAQYGHTVAQLLITRSVISNTEQRGNAVATLERLFSLGVVPIVNANDTVSIKNLDFDENDTLAAVVAKLTKADLLILLTDVDGLYDAPPSDAGAKLITHAEKVTYDMINSVGDKGSELASGGMLTKLEAASLALEDGIKTVIANGIAPEILYGILDGTAVCTVIGE